jgi:hypothetical protein
VGVPDLLIHDRLNVAVNYHAIRAVWH